MLSVSSILSRLVPLAVLVAVLSSWSDAPRAEAKAPLPDYVIKEFGTPPAIPEGPLPEALQAAVNTAFIDAMKQKSWEDAQTKALDEITKARDPRVAWLIADLMRFATDTELTLELAWAASRLLG
ncbi:MAG: hypothetical protein ACPGRZ_10335 [Alphaproteobacteria bacterium]